MKKLILISILIGLISACSGGSKNGGGVTTVDVPPVVKNLGVNIDTYNSETGKAGSIDFSKAGPIGNDVFIGFGIEKGDGTIYPTFEYLADEDADVYAIADGVVTDIQYREDHQDYSIIIRPVENSSWMVVHDHVLNPSVSLEQEVSAGDVIGNPGTWYGGLGRTELQVIDESGDVSYCPFDLFDSSVLSQYQSKITQLMQDWETFKSDSTIFDQDTMIDPGCWSVTVQQ